MYFKNIKLVYIVPFLCMSFIGLNINWQSMGSEGILFSISLPTASAQPVSVSLTPSKDNSIYDDSGDLSNGAGQYLFSGLTRLNQIRRGLLAFGNITAQIPSGATIQSATLTLNLSKTSISSGRTVGLYPLVADWGEGTSDATGAEGTGTTATTDDATWTHRFYPNQTWSSVGGDYTATASATTTVSTLGSYTWSSSQMAQDVQNWLDSPNSNFGWILIGNESMAQSAARFDSRENPTTGSRPLLEIVYSLPATPTPQPTSSPTPIPSDTPQPPTSTPTLLPTSTPTRTPTSVQPTDTPVPQTPTSTPFLTATPTPTGSLLPTDTPVNTSTPTPDVTQTPSPTPLVPKVLLGGYWNSDFQSGQVSNGFLIALLSPEHHFLSEVEIGLGGTGAGIYLYDDGAHGDFLPGDGIYGLEIPLPPTTPSGMFILEVMATDVMQKPVWPYLIVSP